MKPIKTGERCTHCGKELTVETNDELSEIQSAKKAMIELLGFKKLGERIKEIEKTVGYVSYPCDCATEMGKLAQEQFELDLRAIETELKSAVASEYWSDRIYDLISAIDSALEHKGEGSE